MSFLIIYTVNGSKAEAEKISKQLLQQKLIACANIFPIESAYWWQGNIAKDGEFVALFKTRSEHWERIKAEVLRLHTYELPCILHWTVSANEEYEAWIQAETVLKLAD